MVVSVMGDANEVMVSQMQTGNAFLADVTGSGNLIEAEQDSVQSAAEFVVEGDDNALSLTQLGDGGPLGFFFNRSINTVSGSGNTMSIYQGDGGNWANNSIEGDDNSISVEQVGEWHESYVRDLT